jgi:WS/DGAT/MGAT family acyltransferase
MAARSSQQFVDVPPEVLDATDAALWDIERNPALRTTIVAALVLDRPVADDPLWHVLEAASRQVPRLRQRVVGATAGIGPPHWEIDPEFDLSRHVQIVRLDRDVDQAAIAAVAEPMAGAAFDRTRALWECVLVRGASARAALVLKVHHSLTDGVGGVQLLDALLDRRRSAPPRDLARIPIPRAARSCGAGGSNDRLVVRAAGLPFDLAGAATTAAFHPRHTAREAWRATRSAARLLAPSSAPLSDLMAGRSASRRVGVVDVELDRLRGAARRHGCTVNHAYFAGVAGGLAAYHRELGHPVERLRVTMPVSIRSGDDPSAGNRWAPVRLIVPVGIEDPVERMHAMATLVRAGRAERALSFSRRLAGAVQLLPSALSSGIVSGMMHGVDATLTNVPGLIEPHYLAGAEVERLYAFAPTAGTALNVGLVSHLDTACIGILSDAAAVSDPDLLRRLIASGLEEVVSAADQRRPASRPPAHD